MDGLLLCTVFGKITAMTWTFEEARIGIMINPHAHFSLTLLFILRCKRVFNYLLDFPPEQQMQ